MLLNLHSPNIAFTDPPDEEEPYWDLRFRDCSSLAEAFCGLEIYHVLNRKHLEAHPSADNYRRLAKVETEQISYWNPTRIGDVIFNF
ncbi:MAG: hypothetical protein KDA84_08335 [Planctomycetaceae bacterium]|nr:hypothetical protein [Planctomycetaceae bacterium]